MLTISSDAIIEKNKLTSDSTWLLLLEITYPSETPIRICLNNENVTWDSETWIPALFTLSNISETKDSEVPSIPLTFYDLDRTIIPFLEEYDGGIGAEVIIRVVNSNYLSETKPELEETTEIIDTLVDDSGRIQFKLGAENLANQGCPPHRFLKNHCRFVFKETLCGYSGAETECDRTYARCVELGNSTRFGGFIGIGTLGVKI